jgi:GNAT superfamily N-acetyltransferase
MEYIRLTEETRPWFAPLTDGGREDLWTEADCHALGAVDRGRACGLLVFHWTGEIADIVRLVVSDDCRRRGVATGLVQSLCRHAYAATAPVTAVFAARDKGDPLYLLFANMDNFTVGEEEGGVFRLACGEIRASRRLEAFLPRQAVVRPFFSLPEREQERFLRRPDIQNLRYVQEWAEHRERMEEPLCLCFAEESAEAAVFVERTAENGLLLAFVRHDRQRQKSLFGVLAELEKRIAESDTQATLTIEAVTAVSAGTVEKLYPGVRPAERFFRAVWDMTPRED